MVVVVEVEVEVERRKMLLLLFDKKKYNFSCLLSSLFLSLLIAKTLKFLQFCTHFLCFAFLLVPLVGIVVEILFSTSADAAAAA